MITYEKIENNKISVKVPFNIKDIFKEHFKTTKWNGETKSWIISSDLEPKLIQFIEALDAKLKTLEDLNQQLATEEELTLITEKVNQIIKEKEKAIRDREEVESILSILKNKTQELNILTAELERELDAKKSAENEIKEIVNKVMDLEEIKSAIRTMQSTLNKVGKQYKEKYYEAQNVIIESRDRLTELNLKSKGLNKLSNMNYNRPDRDIPSSITESDIYNIEEL